MKFNLISTLCSMLIVSILYSCSDENLVPYQDSPEGIFQLEEVSKEKSISKARVSLETYVTRPVVPGTRTVILEKDGTTEVTWIVTVRRDNANDEIHKVFVLTNGNPFSQQYGSITIRTLDLGSSLEKTYTLKATVTGTPSRLNIVTRDYLTSSLNYITASSYNATTTPGEINGWITSPSGGARFDEGRGYVVKWNKNLISTSNVRLSIYRNGVSKRIFIDVGGKLAFFDGKTSPLANTGARRVYMPSVPSNGSKRYGWTIKVEAADDTDLYDFSPNFEILDDD